MRKSNKSHAMPMKCIVGTSSHRPCFLCSRHISLARISCSVSLETAYWSFSMRSTAALHVALPNLRWSSFMRSCITGGPNRQTHRSITYPFNQSHIHSINSINTAGDQSHIHSINSINTAVDQTGKRTDHISIQSITSILQRTKQANALITYPFNQLHIHSINYINTFLKEGCLMTWKSAEV